MTPGLMTRLTLSACLPLSCLGLFLKTAGDYPTSFKNLPPGAIFKQKRKGHKVQTPQPPRAQVGQCDARFSERSQWYGPDPHAVIHLIAHAVTGFLPVLHSQSPLFHLCFLRSPPLMRYLSSSVSLSHLNFRQQRTHWWHVIHTDLLYHEGGDGPSSLQLKLTPQWCFSF